MTKTQVGTLLNRLPKVCRGIRRSIALAANPRINFKRDLLKEVAGYKSKGYSIILMGDFHEHIMATRVGVTLACFLLMQVLQKFWSSLLASTV